MKKNRVPKNGLAGLIRSSEEALLLLLAAALALAIMPLAGIEKSSILIAGLALTASFVAAFYYVSDRFDMPSEGRAKNSKKRFFAKHKILSAIFVIWTLVIVASTLQTHANLKKIEKTSQELSVGER